jgi:antitoxin VapB
MPLNIRDPRASELARDLAARRGTSMTKAIIGALENELTREKAKPPLAMRVREISSALMASAAGGWRKLTKAEIDKMWGH